MRDNYHPDVSFVTFIATLTTSAVESQTLALRSPELQDITSIPMTFC